MMNHRVFWMAGFVLMINAIILGGVLYNRSSGMQPAISLTERELPISYSSEENTGLSLQFRWHQPNRREDEQEEGAAWFDKAKLEAVGYDCHVGLDDPSADIYYRKALPRRAYVVFEYDGSGWSKQLNHWQNYIVATADQISQGKRTPQVLRAAQNEFERMRKAGSRLVPVDVGSDPVQLRQQYSDATRYLIMPALVGLQFVSGTTRSGMKGAQTPYLRGVVLHPLIQEIHVPVEQRSLLDEIRREDQQRGSPRGIDRSNSIREPRYSVSVVNGKRYEPWIVKIERFTQNQDSMVTPIVPLPVQPTLANQESPSVPVSSMTVELGVLKEKPLGQTVLLNEGDTLLPGDNFAIVIRPEKQSHIYVWQTDQSGEVIRVFPNNEFSPHGNPVEAQTEILLPEIKGRKVWFNVDLKPGVMEIVILAATGPLQEVEDPLGLLSLSGVVDSKTKRRIVSDLQRAQNKLGVGKPVLDPTRVAHSSSASFPTRTLEGDSKGFYYQIHLKKPCCASPSKRP